LVAFITPAMARAVQRLGVHARGDAVIEDSISLIGSSVTWPTKAPSMLGQLDPRAHDRRFFGRDDGMLSAFEPRRSDR
jgi:hypothetical protein